MKVGAMIFFTDETISPAELAVEVETRGFESLWVPEKTHVPTSRRTPWPGGPLPEWYKRTYDPFVALTAAAAATTRLRVGTGVCLVPIHDPVILAKTVASLDHVSGGRLEFGVGYGWNAEEFATHGVDLDGEAAPLLAEKLELMTALWRDDVAEHSGHRLALEASWSWPKPVQRPRPPIWLGSRATPAAFADIASWGDGWLPIEGYGEVISHVPALREAFVDAGRDPDDARVGVYSSSGDPRLVEAYEQAGVERVALALPPAGRDDVLCALDLHTSNLAEFLVATAAT